MQHEGKRKHVPGIHSHISMISELRQELNKVNESITDLRNKISAIYKQEKESSPRVELHKRFDCLRTEVNELRESKARMLESRSDVLSAYDGIRTGIPFEKGKTRKHMAASEIDDRIKEINFVLISNQQDKKKFQALSAEIDDLKKQKKDIGISEQKHQAALEMKTKLDGLNVDVKKLSQDIAEKLSIIDKIKVELKELSDKEKDKNPTIEGYEKNILMFKTKKGEIAEKIRGQQEEIKKKEMEYNKFLEGIAIAQALEKQRDELKKKIEKLEGKREELLNGLSKYDPARLDPVIFGVENLGISDGKITLPVDLVLRLNEYKVLIPVSVDQIGQTVDVLRVKRNNFSEDCAEKQREFLSKIAELDRKISEERASLAGMPPVDVKLPKFKRD